MSLVYIYICIFILDIIYVYIIYIILDIIYIYILIYIYIQNSQPWDLKYHKHSSQLEIVCVCVWTSYKSPGVWLFNAPPLSNTGSPG